MDVLDCVSYVDGVIPLLFFILFFHVVGRGMSYGDVCSSFSLFSIFSFSYIRGRMSFATC